MVSQRKIDGRLRLNLADSIGGNVHYEYLADGISIVERNDYYPLGKRYGNTTNTIPNNKYRYSNKEEQSFVDVPYIDYGARMYDPQFRLSWNSIDPLAEKYYGISPYVFCGGNPIRLVDTDGRKLYDASGNLLWNKGALTNYAYKPENATLYRYLNELRKTPTGRSQFNKLVNSERYIKIKIQVSLLERGIYGKTHNYINPLDGADQGALIEIDINNNKEKQKANNISLDQAVASTLGHEIRHTEIANLQLQKASNKKGLSQSIDLPEEEDASKIGDKIIMEYKHKRYENKPINYNYIFKLYSVPWAYQQETKNY